jgi:site-specific recombinase XerD
MLFFKRRVINCLFFFFFLKKKKRAETNMHEHVETKKEDKRLINFLWIMFIVSKFLCL